MLNIIFAATIDSVIGVKDNGEHRLPWPPLLRDMAFFKNITSFCPDNTFNFIIMGNTTWTTLPVSFKKDIKRKSLVLSRSQRTSEYGEVYFNSFESAVNYTKSIDHYKIFVTGGSDIYLASLQYSPSNKIYYTSVNYKLPNTINFEEIVYFPISHSSLLNHNHKLLEKHTSGLTNISYEIYEIDNVISAEYSIIRKFPEKKLLETNKSEEDYINLVKNIYYNGNIKMTRNGIRKSLYNKTLEFDLTQGFPLTTFKRTFFKSILEELLWMLRGQTDVKLLKKVGVNIWNKNSSKEYHILNNLNLEEDDIGPGYGFQMRHYGAEYINCRTNYVGKGLDQINYIINCLNNNPTSSRMVLSLWNPIDLNKMALPPCHVLYIFSVELYSNPILGKKGKLHCSLTQRSWDILLGWNHTTAALLTHILAKHCDYDVGSLLMSIADVHLYECHYKDENKIKSLLSRTGRKYPKLSILDKKDKVENYSYEDFRLEDYEPYSSIQFEMIS